MAHRFINGLMKMVAGLNMSVNRTHHCPVCGSNGECVHSPPEKGEMDIHNCHVCGSTWKEKDGVIIK